MSSTCMSMGQCCTLAESTELGVYFNLWLWHKETMMNKEQNMTFYTDDVWDNLEVSGKAYVDLRAGILGMDNYIDQLHREAKDFGVLLSIKRTDSKYLKDRLYVYLRKNRG